MDFSVDFLLKIVVGKTLDLVIKLIVASL